jgi:DNA-binding PadR family transcriptional regulator
VTGPRLTPTSYVVLGLLMSGPATSYELKRRVQGSIGNFWTFNHSQLYDEPQRLLRAGLIDGQDEEGGRRRRTYSITDRGREALGTWLGEPTRVRTEVRDSGLLKLFFGRYARPEDVRALATDQLDAHRQQADEYSRMRTLLQGRGDRWELASLDLGIAYERRVQAFWEGLLTDLVADG